MTPRMARDPYYADVAARFGVDAALEAGWFDDGEERAVQPEDEVRWLTTPLAHVRERLDSARQPVVLLSTGAMCPTHEGHVAMMENARARLALSGLDVVGGFLSPGHDAYVGPKCGAGAIPASKRLALCADALRAHPWLAVCPWEALHTRTGLNFTDVIRRLEAYLQHHLGRRIPVVYVCGADNARFSLTFATRGACVVVGRPGFDDQLVRYEQDERLRGAEVWFVPSTNPSSSTELRRGSDSRREATPPSLCLRVEDGAAVRTMGLPAPRWERFVAGLLSTLRGHMTVRVVQLSDQRVEIAALTVGPGAVGLDPLLPIGHPFGISRRFALGGYQQLGHVARPDGPSLAHQLSGLPTGPLALFEDDQASGGTLRVLEDLLPGRIQSVRVLTSAGANEDLCDARDFLPGTDHGGLVVDLPDGTLGRAPYVLPYVDPAVRCCVPAEQSLRFSAAIWALAAAAMKDTGLRVSDLPPAAARLYLRAGFRPDEPMERVCAWHEAELLGRMASESLLLG